MADSAQRTLDIQYFIFKDDDSGQLLMSAMLRAASRGVRVRLLVDDTEARGQDDRIGLLAAHPNVDVRLYNPFFYRGSIPLLRYAEFGLTASRLNYRMHNKLFVVDNSIAIVGGRNVGDEYFDTGNELQFGDYDVFAMGPITRDLSKSSTNTGTARWPCRCAPCTATFPPVRNSKRWRRSSRTISPRCATAIR